MSEYMFGTSQVKPSRKDAKAPALATNAGSPAPTMDTPSTNPSPKDLETLGITQ